MQTYGEKSNEVKLTVNTRT